MAKNFIIVTPDTVGPVRNGGIGTACFHYARTLANAGENISILFTGDIVDGSIDHWREWYGALGITFYALNDVPTQKRFAYGMRWYTERSFNIMHFLKARDFDYVLFQDWHGNGFWTNRAKRLGYAFEKTVLGVITHSPNAWQKEGMLSFGDNPLNEADLDWVERQSIAAADVLVSPSHHMVEWLKSKNYELPEQIEICPYTNEDEVYPSRPETLDRDHLIFFGRLETRKGLHLLGGALREIKAKGLPLPRKVSLLGKMAHVEDETTEVYLAALKSELPDIEWFVENNFDYLQAVEYISTQNGLVIIASILDNYPLTVIESIQNGFCFLASQAGGIVEMVDPTVSFPPTIAGAFDLLSRRSEINFHGLKHLYDPGKARDIWLSHTASTAARAKDEAAAASRVSVISNPLPPMSVVTPFFKHDEYLPRLVRNFLLMRVPELQLVVVNDGTPDDACENFNRLKASLEPSGHVFVTQSNAGPGAARNHGVRLAKHDYILFCDADNSPKRDMAHKLWQAMSMANADSVCAPFTAVPPMTRDPMIEEAWFDFHPPGGSLELSLFENTLGDMASLVRKSVINAVGGFTEDRKSWEDHHFFFKVVAAGYKHFVYPEPLVFYTHAPNGRNNSAVTYYNRLNLFSAIENVPPARLHRLTRLLAEHALIRR